MSLKRVNEDFEKDEPSSKKPNNSLVRVELGNSNLEQVEKGSIEKQTCFNFHPEIIIHDYFQSIINKIDINTETLLNDKKLKKTETDKCILMDLREKQIEILYKIKKESLMSFKYDEDTYMHEWDHVINDETLNFKQKVEVMSQELLSKCCILYKDKSILSGQSLWILPASFCNEKLREIINSKVKFRRSPYRLNSFKYECLNKSLVRSFVILKEKKNYRGVAIKDFSQIDTTKLKIPPETPTNNRGVDKSKFGSASNHNIEEVYLYPECFESDAFDDLPNLKSLHLRLVQVDRFDIRFNHLNNLKELCLDYKNDFCSHPRDTNYFSYLPTSLEKLSIIGFDVDLFELSYLSENLTFLELGFNNIFIENLTPFDCFENLKALRIENSKFYFGEYEEFKSKKIHFNLRNLEELDLNEKSNSFSFKPYDPFFHLYFENLPKLKILRFSVHSLSQIDLDSFKNLLTLENLEIWSHESAPFFMDIKNILGNFKEIKSLKIKCVI